MSTNRDGPRQKFGRLADALANDVDNMSDQEILKEAAERHGSVEQAAASVRAIVASAIASAGKQRLHALRKAYDAEIGARQSNVVRLPLERKRALLERFAKNDNALQKKLTLAARNEEDSEADLDSFLEDLVRLGVIDEQGNPR